jgi:hypothetical protein
MWQIAPLIRPNPKVIGGYVLEHDHKKNLAAICSGEEPISSVPAKNVRLIVLSIERFDACFFTYGDFCCNK